MNKAIVFYDRQEGEVIVKGVSSVKTFAATAENIYAMAEREIAICPVLMQQRISGRDIRVHVVGQEGFAEEIRSNGVDYRRRK